MQKLTTIQDDWTIAFCEKFNKLRDIRVIPTNITFASSIGLNITALSHILSGRRNFPKNKRLNAEDVLLHYDEYLKYFQEKNDSEIFQSRIENSALTFEHELSTIGTSSRINYRSKNIHEEIQRLEKQKSKLQQEINQLKDKVIKLQALFIKYLDLR